MDASTTTFVVKVEGQTKTVAAYALGDEPPDAPDARPRAALLALADRLRTLDQIGRFATQPYKPGRYRGVLFEIGPVAGAQVRGWPWPDLAPADFVSPADPTGIALPRRTMTATEIAKLGLPDVGGGVTSIYLSGPAGKGPYVFALRPLLPDEPA
jgi:hypothetical protein